MVQRKLIFGLLVIILLLVPVLGGCKSDETPAESPQSSEVPESPVSITIGYSMDAPPNALDPSNMAADSYVSGNVFDGLISFDTDNQLQGALATSLEMSEDGKMLEMKLRQGVKFSSGDDFTARDVAFSVNRWLQNSLQFQAQMTRFDHFEIVDDYTVRFYFSEPDFQFQRGGAQWVLVMSEEYYNRVGEEAFMENPVGTGPYKFAGWAAGQYVDFEINEYYWGERPQVDKVKLIVAPDPNNRVAMLQSGEVDLITATPYQNVKVLEADGFKMVAKDTAHMVGISFALINPNTPWADVRVRQAINYMIDKDAIIENIFFGVPHKVEWTLPWELGYDAALQPAYPYDPEEAKKLMAEAGYEDGFEMPLIYMVSVPGAKDIADLMASSLQTINIDCVVSPLPFGPEFINKMRQLHDDPTQEAVMVFMAPGPGNAETIEYIDACYWYGNPTTSYHNPEVDALRDEAMATMDAAKRAEIYQEIYKIIDADMPAIPILLQSTIFMTKPDIELTPSWGIGWGYPHWLADITVN